ncbi:MAG TPA: ABC transporter permease [Abditibacteriaceae bacterium]|jgi:simple sugar transport system permease protein
MTSEIAQQFVLTALALAAPLLLAALGELIGERAGVLNIGLEGLMLVGAFAGAAASFYWNCAWIGLFAAIVAGVLLASVFALIAVSWRADAIIVGTGLNLLALGLTGVGHRYFIEKFQAYESVELPQILFGVFGVVLALFLWWFLRRTQIGLQLRAVGEYPQAAETAGVNVQSTRWLATLCNGALCGLAGAFLSQSHTHSFAENMTGGRGFIALAIVIFGRWNPIGAIGAALLFGAAESAQFSLQALVGSGYAPLFLMLPYVITLLTLAGFAGKTRAPMALGQTYER